MRRIYWVTTRLDLQLQKLITRVLYMIKLEENIINMLHNSREISFRYDLLDYNETKIGELTSLGVVWGLIP